MGYGEFKSLREIAVPQGNPAEWVTEVGCRSRRHPGETRQTPTRSRRNRQKSVAKSYRNLVRKIVKLYEKSYQNLVREGPRSLQNRSGTLPEHARTKKMQKNRFLPASADVVTFAGDGFGTILGPGRDPKIDKKRARERKSASGDGAGSDFCRFFLPVPFGVALRTDFWRVRPLKIVLPPQREHDFDKITVFKKTPKK